MAGKPKKYTAKKFREAAERYFRSISARVADEGALNMDGMPVERTVYAVPPTVSGLCVALGIDRRTWRDYADPGAHPAHARVCEDVRLRIEAYLTEQLLTREKAVQGVTFILSNSFGWSERHEHSQRVELGEETRKIVAQNLTLDEKMALIREAASELEAVTGGAGSGSAGGRTGRIAGADGHGGEEE